MRSRLFGAITLIIVSIAVTPEAAHAHFGKGGNGFLTGLFHPVLGYDHLLAMVSVGLLSAQIGGRAIWTVPAAFVSVMAVGGVLGMVNAPIPLVEYGIVISVVALGAAIAAGTQMSLKVSHSFVGLFAVFHGYAHGTEMPLIANPALYALGFMLSTALLHITGVIIGYFAVKSRPGAIALRNCGAAIAALGLYMIISM